MRRLTRAERAAETRERLIEAADEIFVQRGFHSARVEEVAAKAGLTTGAVYSAFGSKPKMFLAVVDRRFDARIAELHELSAAPRGPERTRRAAEQWFERLRRDRAWQATLLEFRLHAARTPELNDAFARRQRRFLAAAARVENDDGTPEGRRSMKAAEAATRALIALGNGYALERLTDPERVTDEEFAQVAIKLMSALDEPGSR